MRFIPHTEADVAAMLETLGVAHLDDLVAHVPEKLRAVAAINLASGMDEAEVATEVTALAARHSGALVVVSFLGGRARGQSGADPAGALGAPGGFAASQTRHQPATGACDAPL